jgi:hypothetical protein
MNADCLASDWRRPFDIQGDAHYSRYNFTDLKKPYDGMDAWGELKLALWPKTGPPISPYISVIPVTTTESEFWWQRNVSGTVGLQLYPTHFLPPHEAGENDEFHWLENLRLYSTYGIREYYDEPRNADPEDEDFRIGCDYYSDNLFDRKGFTYFTYLLWTNLTYRSTNYSLSDYDAVLWEGNMKLGPQFRFNAENSIFLPYAVIDWTFSPDYDDRWWENFIRAGAGVRLYPKVSAENEELERILKRFNIYAEVFHNASWLGDDAPSSVKETDWRIGLNFSTLWDR